MQVSSKNMVTTYLTEIVTNSANDKDVQELGSMGSAVISAWEAVVFDALSSPPAASRSSCDAKSMNGLPSDHGPLFLCVQRNIGSRESGASRQRILPTLVTVSIVAHAAAISAAYQT